MKRAQLLGVAIAGVCGLGAFFGVMSLVNKPTRVVREEVTTNTTQVLVARERDRARPDHGPGELPLAGLAAERASARATSRGASARTPSRTLDGSVARAADAAGRAGNDA